jgi:flavin reductase (DIM6/NTAB) family NADH-FMN oxidoreductase RutF
MTERERKNLVSRITMPQGVVVVVTNDPEPAPGTMTLAEWLATQEEP